MISEGLRAGWPTILTLLTRDQYGHLVHVPNLKVTRKTKLHIQVQHYEV